MNRSFKYRWQSLTPLDRVLAICTLPISLPLVLLFGLAYLLFFGVASFMALIGIEI